MSQQITSNESKKDNSWGPTAPLVGMLLAMVIFGAVYAGNTSTDPAMRAAYSFGQASLMWLLYHLLLKLLTKGKEPFRGLSFLGIWIALFAGSFFSNDLPDSISKQSQAGNEAVALGEISKTYDQFIEQGQDESGMPTRIESLPDTAPKASGDIGEFERFMKVVLKDFAQIRNDYLLELDAIGWEQILMADRLARDAGMVESQLMIKRARDIVYKYKTKYEVRIERARGDILRLDMSEASRQSMSKAFDRGLDESRNKMNKLWSMELAVVDEFAAMIDLLEENPSVWVVENGQVFFDNDAVLARYNAHFNTIDRFVKEQIAMQEQSATNWKKSMETLVK